MIGLRSVKKATVPVWKCGWDIRPWLDITLSVSESLEGKSTSYLQSTRQDFPQGNPKLTKIICRRDLPLYFPCFQPKCVPGHQKPILRLIRQVRPMKSIWYKIWSFGNMIYRWKILTKLLLRPPPAPPRPRPAPSKKSRPEQESPEKEVFPLLFLFSFLFFFSRVGMMSVVETNITSHQYEPELWRPEIKTRRVNTREVLLPFFWAQALILILFFHSRSLKLKKHNQMCHWKYIFLILFLTF